MTRPAATTPVIPIPQIQGRGFASPYVDKAVTTSGVITGVQVSVKAPGFFLQDAKGDEDIATSDGMFVSTLKLPEALRGTFEVGKFVQVSGNVEEAFEMTTLSATEKGIRPIAGKRMLAPEKMPTPVSLAVPPTTVARNLYLEAREGMLATVDNALVMGPSSKFGNFAVVNEEGHGPRRDFGDETPNRRVLIGTRLGPGTQMATGDRVGGIVGPIANQYGDYELLQTRPYGEIQRGAYPPKMWGDMNANDGMDGDDIKAIQEREGMPAAGPNDAADLSGDGKITVKDTRLAKERMELATGAKSITLQTMNAENFFDNVDAPPPIDDDVPSKNSYNNKLARMAGAIRDHLQFPEVLAMQEVEGTAVMKALVERPEMRAMGYKFAYLPTNGHRSINPVVMYRGDNVDVTNVRQVQKMMTAKESKRLGLGAGGANGPEPLFAREPLVVDIELKNGDARVGVTMINNHLISKLSSHGSSTEPIRIAQAKFLNDLVQKLKSERPEREVMVVGDLNDTPSSKSLKALVGPAAKPVLTNVSADMVPQGEAYSYNYKGKSELIDHILVTPGLVPSIERAGVRHVNSDLPDSVHWNGGSLGNTDHDSPYVRLRLPVAMADAKAGADAVAGKK